MKEKISYYVLANSLKDKGNLEEALQYYRKAIAQEKEDNYFLENIYTEMAEIFTEQKKYSEALDAYDNAINFSIKKQGNDSYCSEIYVAKREIYSILNDDDKVKEMDGKFASAENRYKKRPTHIYIGKFKEKFKEIDNRLQKIGKQEEENQEKLFEMLLLVIEEYYSNNLPSYKELEEIIDYLLDEVDHDNTIYNKKTRALEKARLIKRIHDSK